MLISLSFVRSDDFNDPEELVLMPQKGDVLMSGALGKASQPKVFNFYTYVTHHW